MKKSLFSTAALLCAISFNALLASHSNPYEMSQESTRQNRCIRVITEIPVEMAGFMMPRHSCEHAGLPGASEPKKSDAKALVESLLDSSTRKSAKDEPLVELVQLLIALTKNLKVAPSSDNATYLSDPDYDGTVNAGTFGIIGVETDAMAAARKEAATKARAATEAKAAADAAADEAAKAKASEKAAKEVAAREAAAKAARLRSAAETAVGAVDAEAAKAVAEGKAPFTYEDTPLSESDKTRAGLLAKRFARFDAATKTERLKSAARDVIDSNAAVSTLSTNVAIANDILSSLRGTGATYADIRGNWDKLSKPDPKTPSLPPVIPADLSSIAFAALPAAAV